jgi:hypothetical protein
MGMIERSPRLRWGVERRLEFIEFRLYWEGAINRSDIMGFFGVSVPQASKDLSLYQELAPGNIDYDKSEKRYFASPKFMPRFFTPDSDRYLSQLQSNVGRNAHPQEVWLSKLPDFAWMPIPHRRVEPAVLRTLVAAMNAGKAVDILYQSMNPKRPDPLWRGISPHAFGNDGLRWHVRAFCHIDRKFKDFLLSRCMECRAAGDAAASASDDRHWQETIDLKLKPNPKLSKSQQRIIAADYDMDENNQLTITIRKSLLYYFSKRLRLDVAEVMDNPQIIVANKRAFDKALAETMA